MPKGKSNLGRCLTTREVALIHKMRADGYTCAQVAATVGCSIEGVRRYAPGRIGKVPIAPLREAFLASKVPPSEVARRIGWWDSRGYADAGRVTRTLGLRLDVNSHGTPPKLRTMTDAETVQIIAEAIGVSPWAVLPDDDESDVAA